MQLPVPVAENVPFSTLTTLAVGGPARYLATCRTVAELVACLAEARRRRLPTFLLGGGSNLLAADAGFDGLVLRYAGAGVEIEARDGEVLVRAEAGVEWDELVARTVAEGLAGLECTSGIPGRVGAAPMQNVGAYGQEVAETLTAVQAVERSTGRVVELAGQECGFAYRSSRFKGPWRDRYAVTRVDFRLRRRDRGSLRYPELRRRFALAEGQPGPPLAAVRREVLALRRAKSMVLDPADPNRRSAGSFFLNPVIAAGEAEAVRAKVRALGLDPADLPAFPAEGGRVKLAAAWLIERAGFPKGFALGRAGLSSRHALALINRGGASAADLVALASLLRRTVRAAFGVTLEPEPVLLGFDRPVAAILG